MFGINQIRRIGVEGDISDSMTRGYDILRRRMGDVTIQWYVEKNGCLTDEIQIRNNTKISVVLEKVPKDTEAIINFGGQVEVYDPKSWKRIG